MPFTSHVSFREALLMGILGSLILLAYFHHSGVGISPDSVNYLSTAEEWLRSHHLDNFHHEPLVDFPVGYPLWLAFWMKLVTAWKGSPVSFVGLMHVAAFSNVLLFFLLMMATDALLQQFRNFTTRQRLLLLSIYATSPCLLEIYSYAWSETLFLPLCMLALVGLHKFVQQGKLADLCIAALWCAWAWVTRYAGVALVLTGISIILFHGFQKKYLLNRLLQAFIFGGISSCLTGLNLYRNLITGGYATGVREKSLISFTGNLRQAGDVIAGWWPIFTHSMDGILMSLILIVSIIFWIYFMKHQKKFTAEWIMISWALVYLLFMIITASITRFQTLDSRLLSPAYIPLLASWAAICNMGYNWLSQRWQVRASPVLFAGLLIWVGFQVNNWMQNAANYDGIKDAGLPGYTEDGWQQSPSVIFLIQHADVLSQIPVWYSDADDAIYFFTRRQARLLPHKENPCERALFQDTPQALVFWFDDAADDDLISQQQIEQTPDMHVWKHFEDGVIYWKGKHLPQVLQALR
ncbi:MAG: hypothetical protein IRZ29_02190 [Thermoflavifilum sp.]|nr:hypothetical protein [Thermoflavifilum sp.]